MFSIAFGINQVYNRLLECVSNGLLYRNSSQYYALLDILPVGVISKKPHCRGLPYSIRSTDIAFSLTSMHVRNITGHREQIRLELYHMIDAQRSLKQRRAWLGSLMWCYSFVRQTHPGDVSSHFVKKRVLLE